MSVGKPDSVYFWPIKNLLVVKSNDYELTSPPNIMKIKVNKIICKTTFTTKKFFVGLPLVICIDWKNPICIAES